MDRMLACEMTWQGGSALAQTVFTCLYCHRPAAIEDPVLRLYCEATLKCCDLTRQLPPPWRRRTTPLQAWP